jgi:hypothetical protein
MSKTPSFSAAGKTGRRRSRQIGTNLKVYSFACTGAVDPGAE